ncbi:sigma-54-dependent Fis family transcriptional regulator [bacterium]|nr:sigma-54-dependent Fis family transcriptional regulator [bacterium]MBU4510395.1 sigma-54-dependent Fis family transcriptional regulator [bacterium]
MSSSESILEEMNKIKKARKRFIETGEIDSSVVRPIIANSWERCKLAKVSPYLKNSINKLNDKEIKVLLDKNRDLNKTSKPIMEMAEKMIRGSGFRIDLSDKDGYILKIIGDKKILKESEEVGVVIGSNRSETIVGTNSIGITLFTGEPVQIIGPEHYNVYPRYWTCSSAPIRNPSGNIIGVLNMSGKYHLLHKHTLGMVVGIANAIESALKTEKKVFELSINNKFLNTIIESISDGLIVIDKEGKITHLNSIAGGILGKEPPDAIGEPINKLIKTNFSLFDILNNRKGYLEKEITITPFGSKESFQYLLTEKLVEDYEGKSQGIMALFKEMKKVHKLVGGIIGSKPQLNFSNIIGNNEKIKRAVNLAKVASISSCKILIQGESGTGKEIFAQAIHNNSNRREKPFIAINCAAIPRDLVESELFGYEEGAFTGAKRGGKPGKFELAESGTLFLDEIESMPLESQPKLLRVIESNQLMRIGGNKIITTDVRIISSTNQDLLLAIKKGNFREDLLYRINTVTVDIAPLRERKDDIPILVKYICDKIGRRVNKNNIEIDKKVLEVLCEYNWPGNIRELENALESAIILSKNNKITMDAINENIKYFKANNPNPRDNNKAGPLIDLEKEAILKTLEDAKDNISKASKTLGIDRSTLYRKIKKYKISK